MVMDMPNIQKMLPATMKKATAAKGYHKGPPALLQRFPVSCGEEVAITTQYALYSDFA